MRSLNENHPKYDEFMEKVNEALREREEDIIRIRLKYAGKHDPSMAIECDSASRECNHKVALLMKEYDFLYESSPSH